MEQESIMREQKRLQIINALGQAYSIILLLNIKKNMLEVIKFSDGVGHNIRKEDLSNALRKEYIENMIAPSFQKNYMALHQMPYHFIYFILFHILKYLS